ncbi:MAG: proteinase inhibitor [Byssovorax sp.]
MRISALRPPASGAAALVLTLAASLAACSQSAAPASTTGTPDPGPAPEPSTTTGGRCVYTSPFTQAEECREYTGAGWAAGAGADDCAVRSGTFAEDGACEYPSTLGACSIDAGKDTAYTIVFPGEDSSKCASTQMGCEKFAKGTFAPGKVCEGVGPTDPPPDTGGVYQPPELTCSDPLAGEPPGQSDGKVCTRSGIAACTEPGRRFDDYASCKPVLTQRPYWPAPASSYETPKDDPILSDASYMAEIAWAKEQASACGCVCCHSAESAPNGKTSNWYIEKGPNWIDSFNPTGLALVANWIDSTQLGAYPASDNNGFSRDVSGLPSTDPARMVKLFESELARRGYTKADFADATPFGGPLYDQSLYVPSACTGGEGVKSDGSVVWSGGGARYVYVLASGAKNPGVPPNLDEPEGTIWKLDVSPVSKPLTSGIAYGSAPAGTFQAVPEKGAPEALSKGSAYYLYVLADIGIPITRCLFTY